MKGATILEIERKFLTTSPLPFSLEDYPYHSITQSYISFSPTIRIRKQDDTYILTVKGKGHLQREEWETSLSAEEYTFLLQKTEGMPIVKKRYCIPLENQLTAEVDVYEGNLKGLLTTEVEFVTLEKALSYQPPDWMGKDVSDNPSYKNTNLSKYGFPQK